LRWPAVPSCGRWVFERSKQKKIPRVACAWVADETTVRPYEEAFLSVLRERGYVLGRDLVYESRYARGDPNRLPGLIDELIGWAPDVLVGIEPVVRVMMTKTSTIPIVMTNASDPVASGLVKSLSKPDGNVTGVAMQFAELGPKHVELMREMLPTLTRVGQLHDTNVPGSKLHEERTQDAVARLGLTYVPYFVAIRSDLEKNFAEMETHRPDALLGPAGGGLLFGLRQAIVDQTLRLRIPYCVSTSVHTLLGALISYGPRLEDSNRLAATYVDRILRGAAPSELPVEQPSRFFMTINLKTAKALGITVPSTLLARADEVIE
jgi:putative ABC transport system substrate-binding protein